MEQFDTRRHAEDVERPALISDYNAHMGGVDHMDEMISYYSAGRKTITWYNFFSCRNIDMKSFILYNLCHQDVPLTQKQFRLTIADSLVEDFVNEKADPNADVVTPGRKPISPEERLRGKHFAVSDDVRGHCVLCGNKKKPDGRRKGTKTNNYCLKCKKHFCKHILCFQKYHTKYRV